MKKLLDVGCGPHKMKMEGYETTGIDRTLFEGGDVDIQRDLMRGFPFSDNAFDAVVCKHVIEHFTGDDLIFLVNEMWRVTIDRGSISVITPDATSPNSYKDPDHKSKWYGDSFDFWEVDSEGNHIIFRGPEYGASAKLHLQETSINGNLDRMYLLTVLK